MPALRRDILAVVHVRPRLLLSVLGVLSHTVTSALRRSWHDIPVGARAQLTRAAPRKCCRWAAQWRCGELCLVSLPSRATPVLPRCSPAAHEHPMHCGPGGLPFVMKLGSGPMQAPPTALHTPARSAENRILVFVLLHFPFGRRRCGRGGALRACAYMGDGGDSCSADAVPRNSRLVFRTRMVRTDHAQMNVYTYTCAQTQHTPSMMVIAVSPAEAWASAVPFLITMIITMIIPKRECSTHC